MTTEIPIRFEGPILQLLPPEGRVTVKILQLNAPMRLEERRRLMVLGVYLKFTG